MITSELHLDSGNLFPRGALTPQRCGGFSFRGLSLLKGRRHLGGKTSTLGNLVAVGARPGTNLLVAFTVGRVGRRRLSRCDADLAPADPAASGDAALLAGRPAG